MSNLNDHVVTDVKEREKIATRVSMVGIVGNVVLTVFKLIAGIIANSGAMVSDAIHSASDVFATLVVLLGVKFGSKAPDKEHPYGHERFECLAAVAVALFLFCAGITIGYSGVQKIFFTAASDLEIPGALALIAAFTSIVVKEAMYWYTIKAAKRIDSAALKASAWDHRSDAFSSIGSFAGIFGARCGFPRLDAVASLIICILIVKVGISILREAIDKMVDHSCSDEVEQELRQAIQSVDSRLEIDTLRTREFGDKCYVEVEISLPGEMSLKEAHEIGHNAHDFVENKFPKVKHCTVHLNPEPAWEEA